jgi:hypothetical protein
MVDRVYKATLPRVRKELEALRAEFSRVGTKTDWAKLRIEPLMRHLDSLEQLLHSPEFSGESARLGKGVHMFHSDLVYLRDNVRALKKMLEAEKKRLKR